MDWTKKLNPGLLRRQSGGCFLQYRTVARAAFHNIMTNERYTLTFEPHLGPFFSTSLSHSYISAGCIRTHPTLYFDFNSQTVNAKYAKQPNILCNLPSSLHYHLTPRLINPNPTRPYPKRPLIYPPLFSFLLFPSLPFSFLPFPSPFPYSLID